MSKLNISSAFEVSESLEGGNKRNIRNLFSGDEEDEAIPAENRRWHAEIITHLWKWKTRTNVTSFSYRMSRVTNLNIWCQEQSGSNSTEIQEESMKYTRWGLKEFTGLLSHSQQQMSSQGIRGSGELMFITSTSRLCGKNYQKDWSLVYSQGICFSRN